MMKGIFITGTDTGVGKTIVTGLLARYLRKAGHSVVTQKWIQTGYSDFFSSDIGLHLKIMGSVRSDPSVYVKHLLPYAFKTSSSPHLASRIENINIDQSRIIKSFKFLSQRFDFVIVEGLGGALVPFNKKNLMVDIAKKLDLAVLIVAQNKLGAINHTLLTVEALKNRKLEVLGIVFSNIKKENRVILKDNPEIIKVLSGQKIFGVLPWIEDYNELYRKFIPIGNKIKRSFLL